MWALYKPHGGENNSCWWDDANVCFKLDQFGIWISEVLAY
jgi:hypothetical protein